METTNHSSRTLQLTEQKGAIVICEQGQLWLTDNGDDIILSRGERHQISSDLPVVIEPLHADGRFRLEGAQAPRSKQWQIRLQRIVGDIVHDKHLPHAHA